MGLGGVPFHHGANFRFVAPLHRGNFWAATSRHRQAGVVGFGFCFCFLIHQIRVLNCVLDDTMRQV